MAHFFQTPGGRAFTQARIGPRPRTSRSLPHVQLEQYPAPDIARELLELSLLLPHVRQQESRMASPESRALCIPDDLSSGPPEAFIDGNEFCHLHPLPEGSIHLTLPFEIRGAAIEMGWAEQHPAARILAVPQTLVMLYAPRNPRELTTVMKLIVVSYQFARWGKPCEDVAEQLPRVAIA